MMNGSFRAEATLQKAVMDLIHSFSNPDKKFSVNKKPKAFLTL